MKLIILPCLLLLLQGVHKASAQDQEQRQDLPPPRRPQQSGGFGSFLSGWQPLPPLILPSFTPGILGF